MADDPSTLGGGDERTGAVPLGHVHLGPPARADQRRALADDPEHHRRAAALDLQPEPGQRGVVAPGVAGRGRGRRHDGGARRLRPGDGRRRLHLRRHGHAALRREDRPREGRPGRAADGRARAGRDRLLRPRALRVPHGRQLARPGRGAAGLGADHRRQRDPARRVRAAARRRSSTAGRRIACIVATMGTTDAFGLDDLAGMVRVRDELVRTRGSTTCRTSTPTPSSAGRGASSTTTTSTPTRSASGTARCGRWPARRGASATSASPTRSASTSTRPASRRTSRARCCSRTAATCSDSRGARKTRRTSSSRASAIPAGTRSRRRAPGAVRWPRSRTCGCSASTGCRRCSATS